MDDPTAGRKNSYFQGVPIFWGFSERYPVSCGGESLFLRGFHIGIWRGGGTNKGIVTDYMGVPVPLGTFTKGEPHFIREDPHYMGGGNSLEKGF